MKRKLSEVESNTVGISSVCEDDDDLINLTDTEAAISAVIQSEDGAQLCKGALIHQLYAILSNKTDVDNEILNLRSSKGIKLLHFNLAGTAVTTKSHFVMLHADYSADLRNLLETAPEGSSLRSSLIRFIPLAMKYSDKLSILESDLLSAGNGLSSTADSSKGRVLSSALPTFSSTLVSLSAIDIQTIVGTGFLCKRRDIDTDTSNVLWFSHPILGKLAQWIDLSRKQIMVILVI